MNRNPSSSIARRRVSAATACAAVALVSASSPSQAQTAGGTLAKIAESGVFQMAYRESSVPFSYLAGPEKPIGFAVDLCNRVVDAVKKKLNKPDLQVELHSVTSQNRIPLLVNGTIDIECGSTTNNTARGKDVDFALNHFYTGTRLLVKKASGIAGYDDLKGKKVATTTGTTNLGVIRKYSQDKGLDFDIVMGKDHVDSVLVVDTGRALAFAMDDVLLFGLKANSKNPDEWAVVGESLQVEPYAIMVRKNDPAFKQLVDGVLADAMKSGDFEKLYNKWFMSPIPPANVNLNLPMSPQLKDQLKAPNDKPAT